MSVPSWARGRGAWDPNPGVAWEDHAPGGRPPLARSPQPEGRRSPSRRRRVATTRKQDSSSGGSESKYIRLGRTQGVFGAGAWAARAEICELLEGGATPGEVIRAIRSGEEARDELASFPSSFVEQPPARALRPEADTKERPQPRSTGEPSQSQKAKEEAAGPMTVPKSRPSGPAGSLGFRKRAEPPPLERRRHGHRPERPPPAEPSPPGPPPAQASDLEEGESEETESDPGQDDQSGLAFRKKAMPPPEAVRVERRVRPDPPKKVPVRRERTSWTHTGRWLWPSIPVWWRPRSR